jgi:hypothetical protein
VAGIVDEATAFLDFDALSIFQYTPFIINREVYLIPIKSKKELELT